MTKTQTIIRYIGILLATAGVIAFSIVGSSFISDVALAVGVGSLAALLILDTAVAAPLAVALLLVFTLPFERIPSVDIGGISIRMSQLIALLGLGILSVKVIKEKYTFRPYPAALWLVAFFAVAAIGVAQAINLTEGVKSFGFSLFTVLVSVVMVQFIRSTDDLKRVVKILIPSVILVVLFALFQTAGDIVGLPLGLTGLKQGYSKIVLGFPRPQGFSVEPLYLADYLFLPLGAVGALWLGKIKGWNLKLLGPILVGIILVIVLTVSRGAYLALVPFTLTFIIFYPRRTVSVRAIGSFVIVMGIVAAGTVGFLSYSRPDAIQKFVEHATVADLANGESTQGRLMAFQTAYDAWLTKPVVGIGMGNFGPYVKGYPNPETVPGWDIVNNEYLEILCETGALGLAAMAAFVVAIVWRHLRALIRARDEFVRAILVGLLATFMAVLTQYNFFSTLYILPIWGIIGLMVATQNIVLVGDDTTLVTRRAK